MIALLVANAKGGCGKTTIATHLAAAYAAAGHTTVLADGDRQRSSLGWIGRRPVTATPLVGMDWSKAVVEAPRGVKRLVIDAPPALKGERLEELVGWADIVVLPVLPGAFDEEAAQAFLKKLEALKPIAKRRKRIALVGNRTRARTRSTDRLDVFLGEVGHTVVTRLRDSQIYPDTAAAGLSIFDLKGPRAAEHQAEWKPLLDFIDATD